MRRMFTLQKGVVSLLALLVSLRFFHPAQDVPQFELRRRRWLI